MKTYAQYFLNKLGWLLITFVFAFILNFILPRLMPLGVTLLNGVMGQDYPLISFSTLVLTIMLLVTTFIIEILYGIIDPRIQVVQAD